MVREGKKTPSRPIHLMLVGPGRAASAFRFVQLRRLEARDISHAIQKGKERAFMAVLSYACRLWASRLRISVCPIPAKPQVLVENMARVRYGKTGK
jgi:hypothetical protein